MVTYAISLILQFFSRKYFLEYLGTEVLGLNTTATNLLQFLNIAELGIGAAIGFTLYRPLYAKDEKAINEIMTLQGILYKWIGVFVLLGSIVLMAFFPLIFKKITLPLWYAYASFGVMLLGTLLSYFFNYRQVVLTADQKDYKIQYSYRAVMLVKVIVQIFAVRFLTNPYVWWIIIEALFSIIATISLSIVVKRTYPFLTKVRESFSSLRQKHSQLIVKIRQVFYHKIGGFALTQSSPLIIYAYSDLSLVAIYGNYLMICTAIEYLMASVFNSIEGGVGNLVAEDDSNKILSVFKELFSFRFLLNTTVCVGFVILSPMVVTLWIGSQYVLPEVTVILIVTSLFFKVNRACVDNFIFAYGAVGDIYAPLVEAALNIGLSIWLGYYYGLNGILAGVAISLFIVIFCWKPYYLFKVGFRKSIKSYMVLLSKNILASSVGIIVVVVLLRFVRNEPGSSALSFFKMAMVLLGYVAVCGLLQLVLKTNVNNFYKRLYSFLCK